VKRKTRDLLTREEIFIWSRQGKGNGPGSASQRGEVSRQEGRKITWCSSGKFPWIDIGKKILKVIEEHWRSKKRETDKKTASWNFH